MKTVILQCRLCGRNWRVTIPDTYMYKIKHGQALLFNGESVVRVAKCPDCDEQVVRVRSTT